MDDHDFVFVNKQLSAKEEKEFSDFLKSRKTKLKTKPNSRILRKGKRVMSEEKHRDSKFAELIEEAKKSGVASDKKTKKEFAKRGLNF